MAPLVQLPQLNLGVSGLHHVHCLLTVLKPSLLAILMLAATPKGTAPYVSIYHFGFSFWLVSLFLSLGAMKKYFF